MNAELTANYSFFSIVALLIKHIHMKRKMLESRNIQFSFLHYNFSHICNKKKHEIRKVGLIGIDVNGRRSWLIRVDSSL